MVDINIGPSKQHFLFISISSALGFLTLESCLRVPSKRAPSKLKPYQKMIPTRLYSSSSGSTVTASLLSTSKSTTYPQNDIFLDRVRLYCLAEKICLSSLMDLTMRILFLNYKKLNKMPMDKAVSLTYQISAPKSCACAFMARSIAWTITQDTSSPWTTEGLVGMMTSSELTYDVTGLLRGTRNRNLHGPYDGKSANAMDSKKPRMPIPGR